jgi:Polyketide synthase dehydratase N-terminal domain
VTTHFSARVRLTNQAPETLTGPAPGGPTGTVIEAAEIYRIYFHGPAYQVVGRAWRDGDRIIGQLAENLPHNHHPHEKPTLMAPRLIELCFQTAGLWEMSAEGRMGLPLHIDKVSVRRAPDDSKGGVYAVVTPNLEQESFDAEILDAKGKQFVELRGYRTIALPSSVDVEPLKALHAVPV